MRAPGEDGRGTADGRGRLLLFDVDGTLVRVGGAGREALRLAMEEVYGETGPIDGYDFHGRTDPSIVRGLLRAAGRSDAVIEEGFRRLWKRYREHLGRELAARRGSLRVCPGVRELLAAIVSERGLFAGLVTGNVEEGAWCKLRACGLDRSFAFGAFGSDSERRADLPPLAVRRATERTGHRFRAPDVFVIGDTPEDIRCARASGYRAVVAATGRHSVEELEGHGPDVLFPDLGDVEAVLSVLVA